MKTSSPLPRASTPTSDQTLALLSLPISQLKRFASLTPDQQRALLLQSSLPPPPFPLPRSRPPSTKRLSAGTPSALPLPLKRSPSPLTSYTVPTSPASRHPRPNSLPLFDYRTSPQPPHLPHAHPIDPPTPDTTAWAATYSLQVSPTQPCDPLPEFKGIRQEDEAEEAVDDPPPSIITYVSRLSIDCSSSPTSPPHPYSPPSRSSPSPHSPPSHPPLLSPHNDNKFNLRLNLHPSPPSPTSSAPHPTPPLPFISQLKDRTRHRRGQPSYELTEGGTLLTGGYEINSKGVRRTPALRPSPPSAAPSPLAAPPDGSPIGSPSLSPSNGSVTLGVELRLTDLVRLSDLGAGASGTVVKALHVPSLTLVALKTVSVFDKADRHQLVKELNAFDRARGVGTSLLEFVGACFSEGSCVMALELMSRGSLEQAVQRWGAVRDERFLQGMLRQVLTGLRELASLHCVHRDIKLANLLINHHGCVKISDFGLLRQLSGTQDMCNTFLGTMAFLSPERMTGNAYTTKSDVWSVGVCVVYLVRGRLAMPTEYWSLLSVVNGAAPTLTPDDGASTLLCDFVQHMLRKDPTDRWSADQLLAHPFMTSELPEGDAADGGWPVMAEADVDEGELALIAEGCHHSLPPGRVDGGGGGGTRGASR